MRYLTTTANWRELDVVATRTIARVGLRSRYLGMLEQGARPWRGLDWAAQLSDGQRELWAPMSALLASIGAPIESLDVRGLCLSYELDAAHDHVSEAWGIELSVRDEQVCAVFLSGPAYEFGEVFGGPFLAGLGVDASREQLLTRIGAPPLSSSYQDELRYRCVLGPLALLFVFVDEALKLLIIEAAAS